MIENIWKNVQGSNTSENFSIDDWSRDFMIKDEFQKFLSVMTVSYFVSPKIYQQRPWKIVSSYKWIKNKIY